MRLSATIVSYKYSNDTTPLVTYRTILNGQPLYLFESNREVSISLVHNLKHYDIRSYCCHQDVIDWLVREIKAFKSKKSKARRRYLLSNSNCDALKLHIYEQNTKLFGSLRKTCSFWGFRQTSIWNLMRKEKYSRKIDSSLKRVEADLW